MAKLHPLDVRFKASNREPVHGLRLKGIGLSPGPSKPRSPAPVSPPAPRAKACRATSGPWGTQRPDAPAELPTLAKKPGIRDLVKDVLGADTAPKLSATPEPARYLRVAIIVAALVFVAIQTWGLDFQGLQVVDPPAMVTPDF